MKKVLFFYFLLSSFLMFSQQEDAWVYLNDKPNSATFIANPLQMLSQRSLDRRTIQNIQLDISDVPIDENFYNQLKNDGTITILGKSKWLNAIHVQGTVEAIINLSTKFNFIASIEFANKSLNKNNKRTSKKVVSNHQYKFSEQKTDFSYGATKNQVEMLKAHFLHQQGFTGTDQIIAVIDAGFPNVNTLSAFQRIRDNNQILGGYNFADRNSNFYTRDSHGTHVLSTIAGFIDNQFVGTAPDAKFYLFISEIAETETVLEETLWVEAAEKADSLGVNIINTSLGYTTFDNPSHNYSYADMDGKTTFISRGAKIGASKGMILVNAAGNSGNDSWKYIGAPADVETVFSIGAVTSTRSIASFSSFGPTFDNRIKPDVLAQGQNSAIIHFTSGFPVTSNGTSFSSPIMAGVIACFWEAFPNKTSSEIMDLIRNSADKFSSPLNQFGFGIPDFEVAYNRVLSVNNFINLADARIFPNPVNTSFTIKTHKDSLNDFILQLYTILGTKVFEKKQLNSNLIDISDIKNGVYLLKIQSENQYKTVKLIKQ